MLEHRLHCPVPLPNKAFIFVSNIELILQFAALGKGIYFDIIDSFSLRV